MIDILIILFINSLCIVGFNLSTNEGMILGKLATWTEYYLPEWLNKPLWACPYCMSSIHSTYIFIPLALQIDNSFAWWPVYIIALCGITSITYNASEILRRYS